MLGVAVALAVGWVIFVPTADWLATHDVGQVTGALRTFRLQTARDAARGRLLTFGAGLFAALALVYTARNFSLSREGQVTDRYTKAIGQLGSMQLDERIGGIYALERIARDSARDHVTVMAVLAAFVREHSREQWAPPEHGTDKLRPTRGARPDVQAALAVIGRRVSTRGPRHIDLYAANLTNASLYGANFTNADLADVDFSSAYLKHANLARAYARRAILTRANLINATLAGADFTDADFTDADLTGADLTGADLTGASFPQGVQIPEGWVRDAVSGKLRQANEKPREAS